MQFTEAVRIYIGENDYTENFIQNTAVKNRQGNLIPMSQFSTLREIEGEPDYNHLDGDRSIKVTASIADGRPRGRPNKVEENSTTADSDSVSVTSNDSDSSAAQPARSL